MRNRTGPAAVVIAVAALALTGCAGEDAQACPDTRQVFTPSATRRPTARMRRSTVHRATGRPARRRAAWILRAP